MLYLYLGTDRDKARAKMGADVAKATKNVDVVRTTDANSIEDLKAALQGGGMFGGKQVLVFEGVCANPELCDVFLDSLEALSKSEEDIFVYEEKPLVDIRKRLEKYAKSVEKFDAPKSERDNSVFALANALERKDKKALWVGYMRELEKGTAPEAIHGILFWAAKQQLLKAGSNAAGVAAAQKRVIALIELPHEARRRGFDMEYALEKFVLSVA